MDERLHPNLEPVAGLVGTWFGAGKGEYPTVESFGYTEEARFQPVAGKPLLLYEQRTWREDGTPSHGEMGYWHLPGDGTVELVLAHTTGVTEIAEGRVEDGRISVESTSVVGTTTAKEVTSLERVFTLEGDVLTYDLRMAAVGKPVAAHVTARLLRVASAVSS